jgi:hypothetical protein
MTAGILLTLPSGPVSGLYRARGLYGRAVWVGPDRGEMAFAGTLRSDQQHDPVGPFGPTIDQREACGVSRPFEKIVAGQAC